MGILKDKIFHFKTSRLYRFSDFLLNLLGNAKHQIMGKSVRLVAK